MMSPRGKSIRGSGICIGSGGEKELRGPRDMYKEKRWLSLSAYKFKTPKMVLNDLASGRTTQLIDAKMELNDLVSNEK
jgi:hypothetical protein